MKHDYLFFKNEMMKNLSIIDNKQYYENKTTIIEKILKLDVQTNNCPRCQIEMEAYYSEYQCDEGITCCPECGLIKKSLIHGDINKTKTPVFIPCIHFEKKLNQVFGYTMPKDANVLKEIRHYLIQNQINELSVDVLRKILKKLGHSKYYEYTSYFISELTGVRPPNIPQEILKRAGCMFKKIIEIRKNICEQDDSVGRNNPPYLFIIYKIFDFILQKDDIENRRILHFINLPSKTTLEKRNKEWSIIMKQFE